MESKTHKSYICSDSESLLMHFRLVMLSLAFIFLIAGQIPPEAAEAKFPRTNYGNPEQTYAVFTMIALAIAGMGIFSALYARETEATKQKS